MNVTPAFVFVPQLPLPSRGPPAWRKLKTYPVCSASSSEKKHSKPRRHRVERRPELVGALPLWLISFALGRRRGTRQDSSLPSHRVPNEVGFLGETETGKYEKHAEQTAAEKQAHELHKATTVAKGWQAQYERAQAEVMQLKTKCEHAQTELSILRDQLRRQAKIEAAATTGAAAPLPETLGVTSRTGTGVSIASGSYHKTSQALFTSLCISQTQTVAAVRRSRELQDKIIGMERNLSTNYEELASAVETLTVERDAARSDSVKMSALALLIATASLAEWASRSPKLMSGLMALVSFHME